MKNTISKYYIKELWTYTQCNQALEGKQYILKELQLNMAFLNDRLQLVGIFYSECGDVIYCCPKYISDEKIKIAESDISVANDIQRHMELICRTLDKLRMEGKNIPEISYEFAAHTTNREGKRINRYNLAKMLIQDYLEHGVYFETDKTKGHTGRGRIHWGATIKGCKPIVCNNMVVYTNMIKQTNCKSYDKMMTEIHRNVLRQCLKYLQPMGRYTNIEMPEVRIIYKEEKMCDFVDYIKQRMAFVYSNREIDLFKALISWCGESVYYKGRGCTTSFLGVWQWVNDFVWGNVPQTVIRSTPPTYQIAGKEYIGTGNAEPDTIAIIDFDKKPEKGVVVFDSKYYVLKRLDSIEKKIEGFPQNQDIVKQVAYRQRLEDALGKNNVEYANVFLIPYCAECGIKPEVYSYFGHAQSGNFESVKRHFRFLNDQSVKERYNESVGIMILNAEIVYQRYLSGRKSKPEEIEAIINEYNSHKQQL